MHAPKLQLEKTQDCTERLPFFTPSIRRLLNGSSRNPEGKKSYLSGSKKIKEMSYDQFLRFIFPEGMFDYFELSDFKEKSDRVEIYLDVYKRQLLY